METRAIIISAFVLFSANLATAQKAQDDAPKAPAARVESKEHAVKQALDADAWKQRLGESDLSLREDDFDRLVERALGDEEVLDQLREWARGNDELAWTARLALREVELRRNPIAGWLDSRDLDGLLSDAIPPMQGGRLHGAGMIRGLENRLNRLLEDHGQSRSSQRSENFRMESTPSGVRVEITEKKDGKDQVKTYEAKSLDELYEEYPDLRDQLGIVDSSTGGLRGELERLRNGLRDEAGEVPTDRLGIVMREPGQWSASVEGVEPGTGLYVERVFPGTLAEALGLRNGDILLSLNAKTLRDAADVRSVLEARKPGEPVRARVVDRRGEERELVWTPTAEEGK